MGDSIATVQTGVQGDTNAPANTYVKTDNNATATVQGGIVGSTFLQSLGLLLLEKQNATTTASIGTAPILLADATGGAFTATLPAAAASAKQVRICVKTDSGGNAVTIKGNGSDNIVIAGTGANTQTLTTSHPTLILYCDGTSWYSLAR